MDELARCGNGCDYNMLTLSAHVMATKEKILIAVFGFLTAASGTATAYLKFAHDKEVKRQDNYEIWNGNLHDKIECDMKALHDSIAVIQKDGC